MPNYIFVFKYKFIPNNTPWATKLSKIIFTYVIDY